MKMTTEVVRLALEFVIANRGNAALLQNSEYREMADACEKELSRRAVEHAIAEQLVANRNQHIPIAQR